MPNIKHECDCGSIIERDAHGKSLRRIGSEPVCLRCYSRQKTYENSTIFKYRKPPPGPTIYGGLHCATLGRL